MGNNNTVELYLGKNVNINSRLHLYIYVGLKFTPVKLEY